MLVSDYTLSFVAATACQSHGIGHVGVGVIIITIVISSDYIYTCNLMSSYSLIISTIYKTQDTKIQDTRYKSLFKVSF